jgi:hypothetical protein
MENQTSVLKFPTEFVCSVIVNNSTLTSNELNKLYPAISIKQFGLNRAKLERKGVVKALEKNDKTINELLDYTPDEVRELIKFNEGLSPKELNAKYSHIPMGVFRAYMRWMFDDVYQVRRKEKKVEKFRQISLGKVGAYQDKGIQQKNDIHNRIGELIVESEVSGVIPCLPHIDCFGELAIERYTKANTFLGIANEMSVYQAMTIKKDLLGLPMETAYGNMLDILSLYKTNSFAHINMDFCGAMPTQIPTVVHAIENNLVQVNGYLFLTFQRIVRKVTKGYYSGVWNNFKKLNPSYSEMTDSDFANDMLLTMVLGANYLRVEKIMYQTETPMVFYAVKRIK